ncbi:hypothetical protein ACKS0A_10626 [Histoplasma ohiense]
MSLAVIFSGTFIMDEIDCLLVGEVASVVFQAPPPHGSIALPESRLLTLVVLVGGAVGTGPFDEAERLKGEVVFSGFGGTEGGSVGVVVDMDENKSKELVEVAGGAAADFVDPTVALTGLKSRPEEVDLCEFGIESKNPPPLSGGEEIFGAVFGDLGGLKDPRFENASNFSGGGGDVVDGKLNPLKASVSSPNASDCDLACCCGWGENDPNEVLRSWWAGACGLGADAYKDRIDCLRSGLEGPVEPTLDDVVLDERFAAG